LTKREGTNSHTFFFSLSAHSLGYKKAFPWAKHKSTCVMRFTARTHYATHPLLISGWNRITSAGRKKVTKFASIENSANVFVFFSSDDEWCFVAKQYMGRGLCCWCCCGRLTRKRRNDDRVDAADWQTHIWWPWNCKISKHWLYTIMMETKWKKNVGRFSNPKTKTKLFILFHHPWQARWFSFKILVRYKSDFCHPWEIR